MRPILTLIPIAGAAVLAAACAAPNDADADADGGRVAVVASFYPLAEAARHIGDTCVDVTNLTPSGVEPHDLELTPDDVEAIASADAVLYLGGGFQPAVQDAIGDAGGRTLDVLGSVDTMDAPVSEAAEGLTVDPHIWLAPGLFAETMPAIARTLEEAAPGASCDFRAAATAYGRGLESLDGEFAAGLSDCARTTIVTNHAAFGYLAAAYGLTQQAISGLEPDAEPTPDRIAQLRDLVEREGITTVFTEELVPPEVAETLASEAGVDTAVLHTIEGLTPDEEAAGDDYRSLMESNLRTLRSALGCP
jgi:zinc transport system substrate-binding protein